MKLFITKTFIILLALLQQIALAQTTSKSATANKEKKPMNTNVQPASKITAGANSIELYDLLAKLIPDAGKTADVSNLGISSAALKWGKPIKSGTAMASINGNSNITFDGTGEVEYDKKDKDFSSLTKCSKYCAEIYVMLDKSSKLYTQFNITAYVDPNDQSFNKYTYANNDAKPNQKLLARLLGKKDFTATFIPGKDDISLNYELDIPGKNKAWVSLMTDGSFFGQREIQPTALLITVLFSKADLDKL